MKINGLQKTTLLDYPGKIAATVFLAGCNFRCPFCHNMNLVEGGEDTENPFPIVKEETFFDFLKLRQGKIDGVCITGGEPTLRPELFDFIRDIKKLGYLVKLDTNGSNPDVVEKLLVDHYIDYVAMDIKSSLPEYPRLCGTDNIDIDAIMRTIRFLKSNHYTYEFRTTIISKYHTVDIITDIGELLSGADTYYLQSFKDSEYVVDHSLKPCSKEKLLIYQELLKSYIHHVFIRGID